MTTATSEVSEIRTPCIGHKEHCGCMTCTDAATDRADWLNDAAVLAAEVLTTLDRSDSTCTCCGLKKKLNWTEHQAAQEIEAAVRKLHDLAERLGPRGDR